MFHAFLGRLETRSLIRGFVIRPPLRLGIPERRSAAETFVSSGSAARRRRTQDEVRGMPRIASASAQRLRKFK